MELDLSPVWDNWRFLLGRLGITVALLLATMAAATAFGVACGLLRAYGPAAVRWIVGFYVDSARAVPILVVLVWTFLAFPLVVGVSLPPLVAAFIPLTFQVSAYVAEIVRAGVTSVRPGQARAGLALGMSRGQVIRRVLLPQAVVRMMPPYASILAVTVKSSAIASVIAVPELLQRSNTVASQSYRPLEVYSAALLVFFVLIFPITRTVDLLYRRIGHLGRS